jgi:2-iminobutanoate/2-iminopropanoate deaminase
MEGSQMSTQRRVIHTDGAPAAIGPYVQAVRVGPQIWTAGQIGLDPASGELVPGGAAAEAAQALSNLRAVLGAAGSGFDDVVKATIFLVDMADFSAVNDVYGGCFTSQPPARSTVAVAGLPRGARVEIELVAVAASD